MAVEAAQRRIGYQSGKLMGQAVEEGPDDKGPSRKFVDQVHEWYRNSARTTEKWRRNAVESYQFVSGEQWDEKVLNDLQNDKINRPALVINKILSKVLFLSGIHRQARAEPSLLPSESQDVFGTQLMRLLLKWSLTRSRDRVVDAVVFTDKVITGLGYWKVIMDYDSEPDGRPAWTRAHPLSIFADPNWFDQGWESAEYVLHATWMTRQQAQDAFPMYEEEIGKQFGEWLSEGSTTTGQDAGTSESAGDSWSGERLFWDPDTQRIRVLEAWYKRRINVTVARNNIDGRVEGDPARVKELRRRLQMMPEAAGDIQFIERPVTEIRCAKVLNSLLLSDDPSPFDAPAFPIFPTLAYYFWQNPFGVVQPMKDPQRERNRRRSTIVEMISQMPLSGFYNKKADGAKTEDIENFAAGNGVVIPYENVMPTRIQPPDLPQTLVWLEQRSDRDIDEVVLIHSEMTGETTQKTVSGKAIQARQSGGMMAHEPLLESTNLDKEPAILFLVKAIQQYMPVGKALRILGTMALRDRTGEVQAAMEQAGTDVAQVLQNAMLAEYDCVFDASKPWQPSVQMAIFDTLREIATEFPGYMPPDVLVNAAKNAGVLGDEDAAKILSFAEQKIQAQMGAGGALPPTPAPGGSQLRRVR